MRKHLVVAIVAISVVALCGCGGKETKKKTTAGQITKESTTVETTEKVTEQVTETTTSLTMTNDIMYAVSVINVRNKPDADGEIITVLNVGDEIERIGTLENGWSKIRVNGDEECYVNTSYITSEKPTEAETPAPETQPETPAPVPETQPETQPETPAPEPETQPEVPQEVAQQQPDLSPEEQKEKAQQYVGADMNSLINAIGAPSDSMHSASCYYEGEQDGIFYYPNFTVYTHTVNGTDYIDYVE